MFSHHQRRRRRQNQNLEMFQILQSKNTPRRAVVVAQLVEHLLPIPEVFSSNPVISKFDIENLLTGLKRRK